MARLNPVPGLLGLSIVVCVVGCMSLPQADFSRDGRTVVVTGGDGIVFHDAAAKRPDVTVKLDDAGSPAFSPDGSLVAVQQNISEKPQAVPANSMPVFAKPPVQSLRTLIVGRDGRIKFRVSNLGGPYAWRPDGTELLGCDGDIAKVVTYRLKLSPGHIACHSHRTKPSGWGPGETWPSRHPYRLYKPTVRSLGCFIAG